MKKKMAITITTPRYNGRWWSDLNALIVFPVKYKQDNF